MSYMFRRTAVLLALSFAFLPSGSSEAQEALQFFKNYFVTGGYAAGGVSLRGTGVGGGRCARQGNRQEG